MNVGMEELKYPSQNPDLKLTENIWVELEHRLHARPQISDHDKLHQQSVSSIVSSSGVKLILTLPTEVGPN